MNDLTPEQLDELERYADSIVWQNHSDFTPSHMRALIAAARRGLALDAAVQAFLAKWDAVLPAITTMSATAAIHHFPYEGPTIVDELEAFRALLAEGAP